MPDTPDHSQFDRFLLLEELGHGGMGTVYRARDPALNREVALKVIRGEVAESADRRGRFLREARAMARLRHSGIVEVFEVGEHEAQPYFTMRLVPGPTLSEIIERGRTPVDEVQRIGVTLARILGYAHSEGFIHRDVKPGNVILENGETPVLLDFGLVQDSEADDTRYTRDSQLLGTPMYMAPELALIGPRAASPASDQYALALILWELLAGRHPFQAPTQIAVLQRAISEDPPSLHSYGVPRSLDRVIRKALAREPANRYPDLLSFADALQYHEVADPGEIAPSRPASDSSADGAPRPDSLIRTLNPSSSSASNRARPTRSWNNPLIAALIALLLTLIAIPGSSFWKERQRALDAEERRVQMEARVDTHIAAGDWEKAEESFTAFEGYGLNAETPALSAAWIGWSERLAESGREEEAHEALAWAYAYSEPASLSEALRPLLRLLWEQGEWDHLQAAMEVVRLRAPALLKDPEIAAIDAEVLALRGDLPGALAAPMREGLRSLARALSGVTAGEVRGELLAEWRNAADAPPLLLFGAPEGRVVQLVRSGDARLGPLRDLDLGPQGRAIPVVPRGAPAPQPLIYRYADRQCRLFAMPADTLETRAEFPCDQLWGAVHDPRDSSTYLASDRTLLRLSWGEGGALDVRGAERSTNNSNSEIRDIEQVDTNGDGVSELWLGTGRWGSYDVRVLQSGPEGLSIQRRRRLGIVESMVPVHYKGRQAIAVVQVHDPHDTLDLRAFGPSPPFGEDRGIHILALGEAGIERLALLPLPPMMADLQLGASFKKAAENTHIFAGDLDGDGADELVIGNRAGWTLVFTPSADGSFHRLTLANLFPMGLHNVDGDPALELLVGTAEEIPRTYYLGAGTGSLPAESAPVIDFPEPPRSANASLRQRWRLAGDLVAMGFTTQSAERLRELAALAEGTDLEVAALLQAARLLDDVGETDRAAELYRMASKSAERRAAALEGAFDAYVRSRRFTQAVEVGNERLALPDEAPAGLAASVAQIESDLAAEVRTIEFGGTEFPPIRVLDAMGLSPDVSRGGLHQVNAGGSESWALDLAYGGGPVALDVELTLNHLDWASGMNLALRDPSGEEYAEGFVWVSGGGGGIQFHRLECPAQPLQWEFKPEAVEGVPLVLRWEYDPASHMSSCTLLREGRELKHTVYPIDIDLDPELSLVMRTGWSQLSVADFTLHRLHLRGLSARSVEPHDDERARRALILGQAEAALKVWGPRRELSDADAMSYALALEGDSHAAELRRRLTGILRSDADAKGALGRALILYPERIMPALTELIGARAYVLLLSANIQRIVAHPDQAEIQRHIVNAAAGVELVTPAEVDNVADASAIVSLLARTGGSWRRLGRAENARRLLQRALDLEEPFLARYSDAEGPDLDYLERELATAAREMAIVQLGTGDSDGAIRWLLHGIGRTPSPELFADTCAVRSDFSLLFGHPGWAQIIAAQRL